MPRFLKYMPLFNKLIRTKISLKNNSSTSECMKNKKRYGKQGGNKYLHTTNQTKLIQETCEEHSQALYQMKRLSFLLDDRLNKTRQLDYFCLKSSSPQNSELSCVFYRFNIIRLVHGLGLFIRFSLFFFKIQQLFTLIKIVYLLFIATQYI
jgi:hypothetical protein